MTSAFVHRHPLEEALSGPSAPAGANHLAVPRRTVIYSVLAHKGHEAAVEAALAALDGVSVRFCGPQEWLAVTGKEGGYGLETALSGIAGASFADQSDGRAILRLSGPEARAVLAKCVAVDLHPSAFAVGRAANVLLCHADCNLARTGEDVYEVAVMRSFAVSVHREILLMGREFGLSSGFED